MPSRQALTILCSGEPTGLSPMSVCAHDQKTRHSLAFCGTNLHLAVKASSNCGTLAATTTNSVGTAGRSTMATATATKLLKTRKTTCSSPSTGSSPMRTTRASGSSESRQISLLSQAIRKICPSCGTAALPTMYSPLLTQ